jgi:hypothetical protein
MAAKGQRLNAIEWAFPLKGLNKSSQYRREMIDYSPDLANVRAFDIVETGKGDYLQKRARGGQRGGYELINTVTGMFVDIATIANKNAPGGVAMAILTSEGIYIGMKLDSLTLISLSDVTADVRLIGYSGKFYLFPDGVSFTARVCEYDTETSSWGTSAWTATAGSIPVSPTSVCVYRNRLVAGGVSASPYNWYMSRVDNPDDWDDGETDAAAATSGSQIGDSITAVAPIRSDYLIIGAKTSLHLLVGDPMAGGQIETISTNIGLHSRTAQCVDDRMNLYLSDGYDLYFFNVNEGLNNISINTIPNMFKPLSEQDTDGFRTDVIDMTYDSEEKGIYIVQRNSLEGKGWFFDMRTGGLFPDTYGG